MGWGISPGISSFLAQELPYFNIKAEEGMGKMRKTVTILMVLWSIILLIIMAGMASVVSIIVIMQGDYIRTAVSDDGTLIWRFHSESGIERNPTGTGDFRADDYAPPRHYLDLYV